MSYSDNWITKYFLRIIILFSGFIADSSAQTFLTAKWDKIYELNSTEKIEAVIKSSDGSFFLVGETTPAGTTGSKILILKVDKDGNQLLQKVIGGNAEYKFKSLIKSQSEGFYLLGTKMEKSSRQLIWVSKLDNNGNLLWEGTTGGGENEIAADMAETSDFGLFVCGSKEIKGDHDTDGWLIKFSRKGVMESQSLFGTRYINDELLSITHDNNGGYLVAGYTSAKIGEEKVPYLICVDSRGNKKWEKTYPDLVRTLPGSIFIRRDGLIICLANVLSVSGAFEKLGKITFNPAGDILSSYYINKFLNISKNSFMEFDNNDLAFLSNPREDLSSSADNYVIRLDNSMNPLWLKQLDIDGVTLKSLYKIDETNFIAAGWYNAGSYKLNSKAMAFQDLSVSEIESYIGKQLIAAAGMTQNENLNDFKNRIGKTKYDTYYAQYKADAMLELKFLPLENIRDTKTAINSRISDNTLVKETPAASGNVVLKGKYYALLIAINDYKDPLINNLDKPISDAQKLFDVLIDQYLFEKANVTFLKNPSREEIISSLDRLERELTKADNLLIFYAGHGYWNETTQKGYWLASDASKQNTANWIGNSSISDYIRSIPAKHTLLIADACFSGSIFKTRDAFGNLDKTAQRLYELTSRKAMTSGTLTVVPDKSVFVEYLLKRLKDNSESFLSSEQLFFSFKPAVLNNTENIPQFGVVGNAGDEGGDFIFIKKK